MFSALGVLFAILFVFVLITRRQHFIWCVAIAMPFFDSAMITIGAFSISPYYFALLLLVVTEAFDSLRNSSRPGSRESRTDLATILLAAFTLWSTLITAVGPTLFRGMRVVPSGLGSGDAAIRGAPLDYTISNLAQVVYLLLNVFLVFYVKRSHASVLNALAMGLGIGVLVASTNAATFILGVPWPHELFDTSARGLYANDLSSVTRLRAQFSEPSHLAAFLVAAIPFFAFYLAFGRRDRSKFMSVVAGIGLPLAVACLALANSGTGIVASAIVLGSAGLTLAARWALSRRAPVAIYMFAPAIGVALVVALPRLIDFLSSSASSKSVSESYLIRSSMDENAIQVVRASLGIGVGLGSNRASSLALMLASTIGLIGLILFFAIVIYVIAYARSSLRPETWMLIGIVVSGVVSFSDFSSPILWLGIAAAYHQKTQIRAKSLDKRSYHEHVLS